MRGEPAVIDLDQYRADPADDLYPAGAERRPRPRRWRPAALVVVAVLLASGLTAAGPPAPPPLVELWTVPDRVRDPLGSTVVQGQSVYVLRSGSGEWTVTAYDLADGTRRWETPPHRWPVGLPGETVAIVGSSPVVLVRDAEDGALTALDPATGEVRWNRPGRLAGELGGRLVLRHPVDPPAEAGDGLGLSLVDPWTGRADLTRVLSGDHLPLVAVREAPDGEAYVFTLDRDGLLSRHPLAEGGTVASVHTPHARRFAGLSVLEDLVVVRHEWPGPLQLVAYDPDTLTPRWTVPGGEFAIQCGPLICMWLSDLAEVDERWHLVAVDPATGTTRWTLHCDDEVDDFEMVPFCGVRASPLADGDRLWVGRGFAAPSSIVDSRTGQRVASVTGWDLVHELADGALLLSRSESGADRPTRDWWARSEADLSGLVVLGAIDADWCDPASYPWLVCWKTGGQVSVWQVIR